MHDAKDDAELHNLGAEVETYGFQKKEEIKKNSTPEEKKETAST